MMPCSAIHLHQNPCGYPTELCTTTGDAREHLNEGGTRYLMGIENVLVGVHILGHECLHLVQKLLCAVGLQRKDTGIHSHYSTRFAARL